MLKLKYLFDNRDLANMILENWVYDKDNTNVMNYFRISSNAIYPFMTEGKMNFLRFAPVEEKCENHILGELDFLRYLGNNGYFVPEIMTTKKGEELMIANTPWGEYFAAVFKGVKGKQLGKFQYSDELYYGYGQALGKLHNLTATYEPKNVYRPNWLEQLEWAKGILEKHPHEENAIIEISILTDFFNTLPVNHYNYGLIHYDFELDNVFYDESTKNYSVIDFDDSVYHWFVMDIERSINSIRDELQQDDQEEAIKHFLLGYEFHRKTDDDMMRLMPMFKRYAVVYGYARRLNAMNETWDNEPDWMRDLRERIEKSMIKTSKKFGSKNALK